MERLAAPTPKPRINLVRYSGVLAPHATVRAEAEIERVGSATYSDGRGSARTQRRAEPGRSEASCEQLATP